MKSKPAHSRGLLSQWHPTKNQALRPEQFAVGSERKAWFLGVCSHEWEASIESMNRGRSCPVCNGRKILPGFNDLATTHPDLAAQWHPTKNSVVTPEHISKGSGRKFWWLGECGHSWESNVLNRSKGQGCPFCSGRRILPGFNDLATTHPDLAAQWHPTRNKAITPNHVSKGHRQNVWWLGECGHEWEAQVTNRVQGTNCPFCANLRVLVGFNDLATSHPHLLDQWDYSKNTSITPQELVYGTKRKVWWLCPEQHSNEASVVEKARGYNCSVCSSVKIVAGTNDLATLNPEAAKQWHPTKNGTVTPSQISYKSSTLYWWLCAEGHEWRTSPNLRSKHGCSYCSGKYRTLGINDLATTHPDLAKQLHPTLNTALIIAAGSPKKMWWLGECGHEWQAQVNHRVTRGDGCPYCSGSKVLSGFNDLATTHPELAAQWHPTKNGSVTPSQVSKGGPNAWWLCEKNHEWEAAVYTRSRGVGCPYCRNYTLLPGFNDLLTVNPGVAAEWHPTLNGELTPEATRSGSYLKVWWVCDKDSQHVWKTSVCKRTRQSGTGCPKCQTSKPEEYLFELLSSWGLTVVRNDRRVLAGKEIDLLVPGRNVGVEFNGLYWHTEGRGKHSTYHHDKYEAAAAAGVQLIQIWEDDFNRDRDLVERLLAEGLGVTQGVQVDAGSLTACVLSAVTAEEFLEGNHLKGFVPGSCYVGLEDADGAVQAVMVLGVQSAGETVIMRYAAAEGVAGGLRALVEYAREQVVPGCTVFTGVSDNCAGDSVMFEQAGFTRTGSVEPGHMFLVKNERVAVEDCNGVLPSGSDRVWDAGGTAYRIRF